MHPLPPSDVGYPGPTHEVFLAAIQSLPWAHDRLRSRRYLAVLPYGPSAHSANELEGQGACIQARVASGSWIPEPRFLYYQQTASEDATTASHEVPMESYAWR